MSAPVRSEHVEAELLSEAASIAPGTPFWVGVSMKHDPHWHTYWLNPADSGLETEIEWHLPEGFTAGAIQWPYPQRIVLEPLVSFGYERDVLLMVEITPPDDLPVGELMEIKATVNWLECKELCMPGSAELSLRLPVDGGLPRINQDQVDRFAAARAQWPMRLADWSFKAVSYPDRIDVLVTPPEGADRVERAEFYIMDPEWVQYGPAQDWTATDTGYMFTLQRDPLYDTPPEKLRGVLVAESGWRGPNSERALYVEADWSDPLALATLPAQRLSSMGVALLFAFLGGLILNLMPCVFPVISLKIMGFVRQAEDHRNKIWQHGLVFMGGVLVSFWVLAGLLLILRAGGEQLGWGFHLQSPTFLVGMSLLFFLLAMNMFGLFEVGMGLTGVGQDATATASWSGSFFSGALATIIATPCTAPFMGVALGYALTLSPVESMLIFTFLGLGMGSPYVLLSRYPQWLARIPKPGPWMETLKQSMGWLLLATVIWLIWVLNIMAGGDAVILLIGLLFLAGLGSWILGRWGNIARETPVRRTAQTLALILILGSLAGGVWSAQAWTKPTVDATDAANGSMEWEPYSPQRLAELRAAGQPVFLDFTAAWCLSCQVNERVVLSSASVRKKFAEKGVTVLKADWTNRDEEIARALASYGRSSVPLYVVYDGEGGEPVILPEILSPGLVLNALDNL